MKWIQMDWHGERIKVPAQKIKGNLWFHIDGETFMVPKPEGRKKAGASSASQDGEILSPMPGKILKVFKSQEDKVSQGDAIIAMEAMKMEYTLEADKSGTLTQLNVAPGDQVTLGQLLAKIE